MERRLNSSPEAELPVPADVLRAALEAMPQPVVLLAPDGRIALASAAWHELAGAGTDREYLNAWRARGVDPAPLAQALSEARQGAPPEARLELAPDQEGRRWQVSLRGLKQAAGVALLVSHHDVTALRQAEEALARASTLEAWGRLTGGVAHDFNNVLAGVIGYGELALTRLERGHPARESVEEILRGGTRAARMVRQLLGLGRREPTPPRPVDLGALVLELSPLLRLLAGEQVALVTRLGQGLRVLADPARLEQVVMNLALNGRDAMPDGGRLELAVERMPDGERVLLRVQDSGIGIPDEDLPRLFEPFFSTKGGTGLGLATVQEIVRECGGEVRVESSLGRGSAFLVCLPAV